MEKLSLMKEDLLGYQKDSLNSWLHRSPYENDQYQNNSSFNNIRSWFKTAREDFKCEHSDDDGPSNPYTFGTPGYSLDSYYEESYSEEDTEKQMEEEDKSDHSSTYSIKKKEIRSYS
jgi:hypothetical protein